jgi:hypothetical protein
MNWKCPNCSCFTTAETACEHCGSSLTGPAATPSAKPEKAPPPAVEVAEAPVVHPLLAPRVATPWEPLRRKPARNSAAPDPQLAERQADTRMRGIIGVLAIAAVVGGGLYFANRTLGGHVAANWAEDPAIPPQISLMIVDQEPSESTVEYVCAQLAEIGRNAQVELKNTPDAERKGKAAKLLRHWEGMDDARSVIAHHHMTDRARMRMTLCREYSQKIGDYLLAFEGDAPPAVTDGSPLEPTLRRMDPAFYAAPAGGAARKPEDPAAVNAAVLKRVVDLYGPNP